MPGLLLFTLAVLAGGTLAARPPGIDFVGVGYNLLKGNPDGGSLSRGGVDPGINLIRNILHISSKDRPDEVVYEDRHSCSTTKKTYMFYGTKTYQEKLGAGIDLTGEGNSEIGKFSFGLSAGYKSAKSQFDKDHKIYQDFQSVCNRGSARYADELTLSRHFSVSEYFAAAVCSLPAKYDTAAYMRFLDEWGTHVIMEVALGTKTIERHRASLSQFFNQIKKSGGFSLSLFGTSLGLDFRKFQSSKIFQQKFGSVDTKIVQGDSSHPEPIHLKVKSIASILSSEYWLGSSATSVCKNARSILPGKKANLLKALNGYASYKLLKPSTDPQLRVPLTWPAGTYGLPTNGHACPAGRVTWSTGSKNIITNTEFHVPANHHGPPIRIVSATKKFSYKSLSFCMKGQAKYSDFDFEWPGGDYCIYKYKTCPSGFQTGSIYWDDLHVPDYVHINHGSYGSIPDGQYGASTRMYFCCRELIHSQQNEEIGLLLLENSKDGSVSSGYLSR